MDDLDVRAERERRGWSQAELARQSGLNANTIGMIERGRLVPYPSQVEKIELALGQVGTRLRHHCAECGAVREERPS